MIIKSQCGADLINMDNVFYIIYDQVNDSNPYRIKAVSNNQQYWIEIGRYKSEERVKEIISDIFGDTALCQKTYIMPKE